MAKWDVSDACRNRVQARVTKILEADTDDRRNPRQTMIDAAAPEDFARVEASIEDIVQQWILGGVLRGFCAQFLRATCYDRREARDAGRSIMNGIRAMGRLRL